MKVLDKYVARNFLVGYVISLCVLIGLRIVIDLFVNLDEFAENAELGTWSVVGNIVRYYGTQSALYFRDFGGMITVVAAVFSLGKMTRNNELVAIVASGVSLKRVIAPIIMLAILLTGIFIVDQELVIPRLANDLVRSHDSRPGQDFYDLWFVNDDKGNLICTQRFEEQNETLFNPAIIIREQIGENQWQVLGIIQSDEAAYNSEKGGWELVNGRYRKIFRTTDRQGIDLKAEAVSFYASNVTPEDMPLRRQETFKPLLSSTQLGMLAKQGLRVKDQAELYSQKNFRVTEPIINMVMLLVALPILVCREPKAMKTAILISFAVTSGCFIVTFACKMVATEAVFGFRVRPEFWAWVPVALFFPIAFLELDSMKT